jgi:hypothetical protein
MTVSLPLLGCGIRTPPDRTLDAGDGRRVVVSCKVIGSDPLDIRQYVYYAMASDGAGTIGPIEVHGSLTTVDFRLLKSTDKGLLGLAVGGTDTVVAVCDFTRRAWHVTGGSWDDVPGTLLMLTLVDGTPPRALAEQKCRRVLSAGEGRDVVIVGVGRVGEPHALVQWYEVRRDGANVIPKDELSALTDANYEPGYSLVSAEDGALIAVVGQKYPQRVYAMHDFSTGLSWPAGPVGAEATAKRMEQLLKRLRQAHPDLEAAGQ